MNDNKETTPKVTTPPKASPAGPNVAPKAASLLSKASLKGLSVPKFSLPYVLLPLMFLRFWFYESPIVLFSFFVSLNKAFLQLFSLPLLIQTYFKPLKNEYRQGLVGFSRAMGIFVKTILIIVDVILLTVLLTSEVIIFTAYIFFPIATVWVLFL